MRLFIQSLLRFHRDVKLRLMRLQLALLVVLLRRGCKTVKNRRNASIPENSRKMRADGCVTMYVSRLTASVTSTFRYVGGQRSTGIKINLSVYLMACGHDFNTYKHQ